MPTSYSLLTKVLYLVRHGEIQSNLDKVYAGWSEEPLTARGKEQAREAANRILNLNLNLNLSAFFTSPLRRAVQTAEIIGETIGCLPVAEKAFKEMKMGPWEGLAEEEIERQHPLDWNTWNTKPAELVLQGRETLRQVLDRVLEGVQRIRRQSVSKSVLIVTHVAVIRVLLLHAKRRDLNEYKRIPVPQNGDIIPIADRLLKV